MIYNNGNIYNSEWENEILERKRKKIKGIYYYEKGDKFKGEFKNDLKEGKGKIIYKNGDIYKGEIKNKLKEGIGIYYYNNGDIYEGV